MEVDIIYPIPAKSPRAKGATRRVFQWIFLAAGVVCPIVNLSAGGRPWSIVVVWTLISVWSLFISRDMVEYNRISQPAKASVYACILMVLIELCLASGWAAFAVPIVCFGTLVLLGILFFSNLQRQRQNLMPLLWLIFISLISLAVSGLLYKHFGWPMLVLTCTAAALLIALAATLRLDLLRELKKRFHTD